MLLAALRRLIPHGIAGLLTPSQDSEALAKAIETLLIDQDMRSRLAEGALQIGRKFSWEGIAKRQEKFYLEAIKSG